MSLWSAFVWDVDSRLPSVLVGFGVASVVSLGFALILPVVFGFA